MNVQDLLKCKTCGSPLNEQAAQSTNGVVRCPFCGNVWTIAKKETDPRALEFLRIGEHGLDVGRFQEAYEAYGKSAECDGEEPEAYFGMALAEFGVRYIKDEVNNRLQPICYRPTDKKFSSNKNYRTAIGFATNEQRAEYERRANEIDHINREFYDLQQSGLDYDCFLCVKVTGEDGGKTEDAKDADEIWLMLREKGYMPFYSERDLRNETGADYEARILYALYTSESMIVICRDEAYLQTPWVKNEYTRFLSLMREQEKDTDAVTIAYWGNVIEKLPGKSGKIQGVDLAKRGSDDRIVNFVEAHTPEHKKKKEAERKAKEEEQNQLQQQLEEMRRQMAEMAAAQPTQDDLKPRSEDDSAKAQRIEKFETLLQLFVYISPVLLSVIFALILFSNHEQISIISNFAGWCFGWVFFTITSLLTSIVLLKCKFGWGYSVGWATNDIKSRVSAVVLSMVMIMFSIIGFSNAGKLSSDFYPPNDIAISVTGKTTSIDGNTMLDGTYRVSSYKTNISFSIANTGEIMISSIKGQLTFYNGTTRVGTYNVQFTGEYYGGSTTDVYVTFTETESNSLYNTSYDDLGVTFQITVLTIKYTDHEYSGDSMILKPIGNLSATENNYRYAVTLHNQGKYSEALPLFQSLGDYKESEQYAKVCEHKSFYEILENDLYSMAGGNAILPDDYSVQSYSSSDYFGWQKCFSATLDVPASQGDAYRTAFITKLKSNGYTEQDAYTYIKGLTTIYIDYVTYYDEQTHGYMHYYAWKNNT